MPADPQQLWQRAVEAAQQKPAMAWVRSCELKSGDQRGLTLAPRPGQRQLMPFLQTRGKDQLSHLLSQWVGRPYRVEIAAPAGPDARQDAPQEGGPVGGPSNNQLREQALSIPLVRQIMEMFETTIVDIRQSPDTPTVAPAETDPPGEDEAADESEGDDEPER